MIELEALEIQVVILRQLAIIRAEIGQIHEGIQHMTEQQTQLDSDVQALTSAAADLEAEVAALKAAQSADQPLDLSGLDAITARLKGDDPGAPVVTEPTVPPVEQAPADASPGDTTSATTDVPPVEPAGDTTGSTDAPAPEAPTS